MAVGGGAATASARFGKALVMAVATETANGPSPWLKCDYEGVKEVGRSTARLRLQVMTRRLAGEGATRRRLAQQQWRKATLLLRARKEAEAR